MTANQAKRPPEAAPSDSTGDNWAAAEGDVDVALLDESLAKTVWDRMQANDDALRLVDLLQTGMLKARAKS